MHWGLPTTPLYLLSPLQMRQSQPFNYSVSKEAMAQGWRSKGPRMGPSSSISARLRAGRASYIQRRRQRECQRGEEISAVSTLTEVNAGAGQPFVTQKEINYCRTVRALAWGATISFLLLAFLVVFVSWNENLQSGSSFCAELPHSLNQHPLHLFFQIRKGRPFYFSISLVSQIHREDRLEAPAKTHPLLHILHCKPILSCWLCLTGQHSLSQSVLLLFCIYLRSSTK